jgi:hypothetical protein
MCAYILDVHGLFWKERKISTQDRADQMLEGSCDQCLADIVGRYSQQGTFSPVKFMMYNCTTGS